MESIPSRDELLRGKGLCITCGKREKHPFSKCRCLTCLVRRRTAARIKLGLRPGYKSGTGRPAYGKLDPVDLNDAMMGATELPKCGSCNGIHPGFNCPIQ